MAPVTTFDKEHNIHIRLYETSDHVSCPYYVLKGKIAKVVASYFSIHQDLVECSSKLQYLLDEPHCPMIVKTSLFNSFVMFYAKCFTENKEGRQLQLNVKDVFKNATPSLLEVHKQVMDVRNDFVAHAGHSEYDKRTMVAILYPDRTKEQVATTIYASLRCFEHSGRKEDYKRLLEYLIQYVGVKLTALRPRLDAEMAEIGLEKMYTEAKLPDISEWTTIDETCYMDSFVPDYCEAAPPATNTMTLAKGFGLFEPFLKGHLP